MSRIIFSALVLMFSGPLPAMADGLELYGTRQNIRLHSDVPLSAAARKEFKPFRKYDYYAAFTFSESGSFSRAGGHNTLESAIEFALELCQAHVPPGGKDCHLHATIVPKGYKEGKNQTLNRKATKWLKKFFANPAGPSAVAANDAGIVRPAFQPSLKQARSEALRICNSAARTHATTVNKVQKCRIIAEVE